MGNLSTKKIPLDVNVAGNFMIPFKDKTYCASPNCNNECGRKLTDEEAAQFDSLNKDGKWAIYYGYFCDEPKPEGIEHD